MKLRNAFFLNFARVAFHVMGQVGLASLGSVIGQRF